MMQILLFPDPRPLVERHWAGIFSWQLPEVSRRLLDEGRGRFIALRRQSEDNLRKRPRSYFNPA